MNQKSLISSGCGVRLVKVVANATASFHIETNNGNGWVESERVYLDFILTVWMNKNIKIELSDIKSKENIARLCYGWYAKTTSNTINGYEEKNKQVLIQNVKPSTTKVKILGAILLLLILVYFGGM